MDTQQQESMPRASDSLAKAPVNESFELDATEAELLEEFGVLTAAEYSNSSCALPTDASGSVVQGED